MRRRSRREGQAQRDVRVGAGDQAQRDGERDERRVRSAAPSFVKARSIAPDIWLGAKELEQEAAKAIATAANAEPPPRAGAPQPRPVPPPPITPPAPGSSHCRKPTP